MQGSTKDHRLPPVCCTANYVSAEESTNQRGIRCLAQPFDLSWAFRQDPNEKSTTGGIWLTDGICCLKREITRGRFNILTPPMTLHRSLCPVDECLRSALNHKSHSCLNNQDLTCTAGFTRIRWVLRGPCLEVGARRVTLHDSKDQPSTVPGNEKLVCFILGEYR